MIQSGDSLFVFSQQFAFQDHKTRRNTLKIPLGGGAGGFTGKALVNIFWLMDYDQ